MLFIIIFWFILLFAIQIIPPEEAAKSTKPVEDTAILHRNRNFTGSSASSNLLFLGGVWLVFFYKVV